MKIKTRVIGANDKLFFTSDLHFFHKFIAKHRGYMSTELMNRTIITQWNKTVPTDAIIYILGDVSFGNQANTLKVLSELNGELNLILGNHDRVLSSEVSALYQTIDKQAELDVSNKEGVKQRLFLSHYSHRVWNKSHYGSYHLFGHSHGSLQGEGKSMDVGWDVKGDLFSYTAIDRLLKDKDVSMVDHHFVKHFTGEKVDDRS